AMVAAAWSGAADADVVVLLVEAQRGLTEGVAAIIDSIDERTKTAKVVLAINKIDRVKPEALLYLAKEMNDAFPFVESFMISAERGHGCKDLKTWLAGQMPEGPFLYPEDQLADLPLRLIAAEMTREKLTLRLHQELPYELTVETESWQERKDGSVRIDQIIYVARDGHKGIILGKGGETIKAISVAARAEIGTFLDQTTHLFLQVKVRPNWLNESTRYTEMGLNFKDGNE
ncbi:MAG: GTPase Era, partial [Rhodobacteraceae bacterium]|nr:GTPase Era [Paracoccaceae bacterium]